MQKRMNIEELFNRQAELFHRDTGYYAPTKEVPSVMQSYSLQEEIDRMNAWRIWHKGFLRGMEVSEGGE